MTITNEDDLDGLKEIGRIVADTMQAMAKAMEPGMTTRELDGIGRALLERDGAASAPETTYDFPGATCISVNEEIAHGIPGDRVLAAGDLVNIDVSAVEGRLLRRHRRHVPPWRRSGRALDRLCRDGQARDADRHRAGAASAGRWPGSATAIGALRLGARLHPDPEPRQPRRRPRAARGARGDPDLAHARRPAADPQGPRASRSSRSCRGAATGPPAARTTGPSTASRPRRSCSTSTRWSRRIAARSSSRGRADGGLWLRSRRCQASSLGAAAGCCAWARRARSLR